MTRLPIALRTCVSASFVSLVMGTTPAPAPAQPVSAFERHWQAGTPATITGYVTVLVADDFERQRADVLTVVTDDRAGRSYGLHVEGDRRPPLRTGMRVSVRGRLEGSELYVAASDGTAMTIQSSAASPTASGHRVLVMVANFLDATPACSMACITDTMFTKADGLTVKNLYAEGSVGRVALDGDVTGPYLLNVHSADPCDLAGWASAADAQALAAGHDPAAYAHKVYVLPANSCPAAGYGSIGGSPSSAWIMKADLAGVYAHEIGHNLGMNHASTPTSEYDDSTDPMAISTWMLHGVNAPHRHQLGWLAAGDFSTLSQSGLYDVAPLALDPALASAPQALLIAKPDTAEMYYLSYRTPTGFDNYIDGSFYYRLSVHRYKGDGSPVRTFRLAGLADGEQFRDAINGITVTLVSHDATHATARVDFTTPCARTPAVALTPSSQGAVAGASLTYTLAVTNTDTAACAGSTFSVSGGVPAGWTAAVSPATLTLAPGASGQAAITVGSAASAPAGSYTVVGAATNAAQTASAASAAGTYAVQGDTTAPAAPSGLQVTPNSKTKQILLAWTASSDNVGVVGYQVWKNGALVGHPTSPSWVDTAWAAGATYTYAVAAYDAAGNVSPQSSSVTVTLQSGRKR